MPWETIVDALDHTGYKLAGRLKALLLSDSETGTLRFCELGDPVYDTTCLACGTTYKEAIGGMLLACTACAPIVRNEIDRA